MEYMFGFLLLLGVLIFIHEFGHFIIAKACGVRVDTFSIGMGKKIIRFRKGETEYALSILPLGGYVKLLGQDPREEVPAGAEGQSFRHKALWQRAAIVLAGPVFNAALAVLVFITLFTVGVPTQAPVIARVLHGTPAYEAGFRGGDLVREVEVLGEGTHRIREFPDLEKIVGDSAGRELLFHIERRDPNRTLVSAGGAPLPTENLKLAFRPVLAMDRDTALGGVLKERGTLPGVEYRDAGPVISVAPNSWAGSRKLPSEVWVEEISFPLNGVEQTLPVTSYPELERAWNKAVTALADQTDGKIAFKGRPILFAEGAQAANPPEEPVTYALAWSQKSEMPAAELDAIGVHSAELTVTEVKKDSPADKLGLRKGDRITRLNGVETPSFRSFKDALQRDASQGGEIRISWQRDGQALEAAIRPESVEARDPYTEAKNKQFQIGAMFLALPAMPEPLVLKGEGPADIVQLAVAKTYQLTESMLASFYHLAKGDISPKTLGGPILIGKIAGESFREGPVAFFRMMAFISLNLFILNLLPIPVLDGGHLLLYCIEAIRRRPLSVRIVEIWTTAGFFVLMGLIAVVFFNDLNRLGLFRFFTG
jgi:regulator of sigma E protease